MKKQIRFSILILSILMIAAKISYGQMSILLVNDNNYTPTRISVIQTALTNNGYSYTDYDPSAQGGSPTYSYMSNFDLVIWYTGNDGVGLYFWDGTDSDNQAIKDYIDNGGMFWLQGLDFLYDRYGAAPDTFSAGDFVYDYLGIQEYHAQSHADDGSTGVAQLDVVPGNPIFTFTPMEWVWSTMWYADALVPAPNADSIYRMGPAGYMFDSYYNSIYLEKGSGKILTIATETAKIDTQTNTDTYFGEGLTYFEQFTNPSILVTSISVYGDGNATTITVDGDSLQMHADVLPANATNPTVTWSVINGTATATISDSGMLYATGTPAGNGTVWVKASAIDGSGVTDSVEITISNQGSTSGYYVLLVNDNNNDATRYQKIETSLDNLGYAYDLYNTISTDTFPDSTLLSNYQTVIWYTGNDGVDLYLWDTSDSTDFKFNAPLKQYVDNGGIVWLQGLDFLYDVFGSAPDSMVAGQFVYDYMGIAEYHAQSHADDSGTGLDEMDTTFNNGIFGISPVVWTYSQLWYADALAGTDDARTVYHMGPDSYMFSNYFCGLYKYAGTATKQGIVMSFAVETARLDSQENTDTLINQGLSYFEYYTNNNVMVENIVVSSENNVTTITSDGGTLQMYADVFPLYAPNNQVSWSVVDGTGTATITADGLLQATGTMAGNGTVWAKATAVDGSGVADSLLITISNQGSSTNFHVLLVNDNNYGTTRYQVIETSLIDLGYNYDVYNTVNTNNYPDSATLADYSVVIWYTGNDGANLYLWDTSDSSNFAFNAPLKQYIDNGGIVWLQGLDYMYDVYGLAPDSFTLGQFVYDYMGIAEYHAQSHTDDGGNGLPEMDTVVNNGIFGLSPVFWTYSELWYADALAKTDHARGSYWMGPDSYTFSNFYSGIYNYAGPAAKQGIVMNFAVETARIDTQDNTDTLINQGLSYFEYYLNNDIFVDSINVYSQNGSNMINVNGGTLQMEADVFPLFAPDNDVDWSVVDGTATATITGDGLLQATGTAAGNGTVWAKASAVDGSGIADSMMVTIINQGSGNGFNVLLVNDNDNDSARYEKIETSLTNLGYNFTVYNTINTATYPDSATLSHNSAVIWYTGNDGVDLYLWDTSDSSNFTFNAPLKQYIDNGGIVWLQGLDYLYDVASAPTVFQEGQFIYDYMGIAEYHAQSHSDDGGTGLPEMDTVVNNGIFGLSPVFWTYSELWYADALAKTNDARGSYMMGPDSYLFSDYYCGLYKYDGTATKKGILMSFSVETARIDTQDNTDTLINQGLSYFEYYLNNDIYADSINVYSENGNVTISEDGGTLQMEADLFPMYAPNNNVVWSVVDGTATATISADGLLQATGTPAGNGTVWAKATAADGSGVADSLMITISNQGAGTGFTILLVNDNNYSADRYLELDTVLMNLGYTYDVYNTDETETYPDSALLENYNMVIWYTGNDGVDLKLWDVSDSSDFKFNAPLINFVDNGGHLWIQGLDFLYDIVGGAPDTFAPGQFIYNYMGIEEYHAQSYADDGGLGLPEMDAVPNNGICTLTPVKWTYSTLWYADALQPAPGVHTVYSMGPSDYVFSDYYTGIDTWINSGSVMTFTIETARIDTRSNTEELFREVIDFYQTTTAVHELPGTSGNFEVYPNPVNNLLVIKPLATKVSSAHFELYNLQGVKVLQQQVSLSNEGFKINTTSLTKGLYLYKITSVDGVFTGKIIKQ